MVALPLTADSQTDEVLLTATLATDRNLYSTISMEGSLDADSQDFFWIVDTTTLTYRIVNLTGNTDGDANRIHQVVQEKLAAEVPFPVERVKQRLAEAQSLKQAGLADFFGRSAAVNAQRLWPYPTCYGGGQAAIGTFDLARIKLTDTYTWSDWWYDGSGSYTASAGGSCWANPATIAGTHWYVAACNGDLSSSLFNADAFTNNLSYNFAFLFDHKYTWVSQRARVYQINGFAFWSTSHIDWGEASLLIFGWTLLGYAGC